MEVVVSVDHKANFLAQLQRDGGRIRSVPEPTVVLPFFAALDLATGIEAALNQGHERVQLVMNREDAQALASYLRRAVLSGI